MMCNLLRCQEEHERATCTHSVFAPKPATAAARTPAKKNPPPVTLVNKAEPSSGKCVTYHITLATACTPAKKDAPALSMLDVLPAPIFLDDPQVRVAVEAMIRAEHVHLPGILVEIVGSQMSCQGRLCKEHKMCRDEVSKEDIVVHLCMVQLLVE